MEILYKSIHSNDDFKTLTNEDIINLTSSVIKVSCEEIIKEIQIDDEIIKNIISNNEVIYNKIKTSNKKSIEIKVKVVTENNREKIYKKIIRVKENSFVYDRNEIEMINSLGKKAYENIINGFTNNENYYETIVDNLEGQLENKDEIVKAISTIIKLSKDINMAPKVNLVEKETIKNSNEVKKVSSQSARYFTMHPEYWYKEGESLPKPIKLLTETFEEDRNIYENQLVKFILNNSKKIVKKTIVNLETQISALYGNITKDKTTIILEELSQDEKCRIELKIAEDEKNLNENKSYLLKFRNINIELESLIQAFENINLNLNLNIRMTQKILYDKRYFRILKIYKDYLSNLEFESKDIIEATNPTIYNYMFLASEIICKVLCRLGFYEIKANSHLNYKNIFTSDDSLILKGNHHVDLENFEFILELGGFNINMPPQIILKLSYKDKEELLKFNVNCDFSDRDSYVDVSDIENLYKIYLSEKYNSNIILNTVSLENMNFENEKTKIKSIFKLSTLGNNFITASDYKKYGGYKVGVIPFSNKDLGSVYDKLIKLFRVKFIKLGFLHYCTYCNNGQFEFREQELLVCNSCSKRIAINKCSCGEDIIKFLSKDNLEFIEEDNKDIIQYHKNYELKSANLGSCYEKFYSNSGGFCSKCGKCQKIDKNCIRCNASDWEE